MNQKFELPEEAQPEKLEVVDANTPAKVISSLSPRPPTPVEMPLPRRMLRKSVTTLTLTSHTCKWPFGDPTSSDFHYCGQPPQVGRPYCDTHDRMSYQSTQRKARS